MPEVGLKAYLLKHTPNPEETIATAAKLCHSTHGMEETIGSLDQYEINILVKQLLDSGDLHTFEHISFSFAIEGLSRDSANKLQSHRLLSYCCQAQNTASEQNGTPASFHFNYITPEKVAGNEELHRIYKEFMDSAGKTYATLLEKLKELGASPDIALRDAAYVLPVAQETKLILTMNGRELFLFFHQECCNHAQWEIQLLADEMLKLCKKAAPMVFSMAGPECLTGSCPHGEYTCGSIKEVRRKYEILL